MWIFGYGSLIWRPGFAFVESRPARVDGWARRFWQGSTDHRGAPGAPGRVVTLVATAGACCFGRAYRIEAADRAAVMAALDHREKGGYTLLQAPLIFAAGTGGAATGFVYIATPDNPNWLGLAPMAAIAAQVRSARGPSGTNLEYVLKLAESLRAMDADDAHVFALEALVRETG